jgi:hypothetical protein
MLVHGADRFHGEFKAQKIDRLRFRDGVPGFLSSLPGTIGDMPAVGQAEVHLINRRLPDATWLSGNA